MPIQKPHLLRAFSYITVLLLWGSNFVGDHFMQIFHFTCSTGTLLVQIAFCGIVVLSETYGFRKTARIIWQSGLTHLVVAFIAFFGLSIPIPEFWLEHEVSLVQGWQQLDVVIMLAVGYICSAYAMLYSASILHMYVRRKWLFLRIIFVIAIGMIVDTFVLSPILLFSTSDSYLGWWKILSLISVKFSLCLYLVPLTYLLVLMFGNKFIYCKTGVIPAFSPRKGEGKAGI